MHENGIIPLIIQNYLSSIVKQQTTQVSQKVAIDLDNMTSIYIIHGCSILLATLIQCFNFLKNKNFVDGTLKNISSRFSKKKEAKPFSTEAKSNSLIIEDLDRY